MSANLKIFTGTFYVKSIDTINERNDYFSPERTENVSFDCRVICPLLRKCALI